MKFYGYAIFEDGKQIGYLAIPVSDWKEALKVFLKKFENIDFDALSDRGKSRY